MVAESLKKCTFCGLENMVEVKGCFGEPIIHGEAHYFCLDCKKITKIVEKTDQL